MVWLVLFAALLSTAAVANAAVGYVEERRRLLAAAKEWYGGLA